MTVATTADASHDHCNPRNPDHTYAMAKQKEDAETAMIPRLTELARAAIAKDGHADHMRLTVAMNPGLIGPVTPAMVYRALCAAGFQVDGHTGRVTPCR
jgi:hypothetical protein